VDYADACGRKLMIGHHRRFNRFVVATKHALPSLGRIIAINGLWTTYKPREYFDPPTQWRRLDSAGPILINLVHEIDILHHWFGPINRVFAEKTISQRGFEAEEGAAITFRFTSGIVGTFVLSDAVVSPHNFEAGTGENPTIPKVSRDSCRIFGSEGSLSFPDLMRWTYPGERSWNEQLECKQLEVSDTKVPFELQVENFARVIGDEGSPLCSGRDGLRAVVVCEAVRESLRRGIPVDIAPEHIL
jgi:predicted dehydrogenase